MELSAGTIVHARYRLVRPLGRGGMGTSWLAQDTLLDGEVALKMLASSSPEMLSAFRAEFSVLRSLRHPHLLRVRDYGAFADAVRTRHYYAADVIAGLTLGDHASGRRFADILPALVDTLSALSFLHRAGVRHGDVKPENVLVDPEGRGVLIDLGCSAPIGMQLGDRVAGTPRFMAPELVRGAQADERADLYAFGVLLGDLAGALAGGLPPEIERLRERLVRKEARERPSGADEVLELLGLEPHEFPRPIRARDVVGRAAATQRFASGVEAILSGTAGPRALYAHGPEGIGCTRLLEELKWSAQLRCAVVEAGPARPQVLRAMLQRACGTSLPEGAAGVIRARDILRERAAPVVLVLDDAHKLGESDTFDLGTLLRIVESTDPIFVLVASHAPPDSAVPEDAALLLEPLDRGAVEEWVRGLVPAAEIDDLMRLSGGYPAAIEALLAQRAADPSGKLASLGKVALLSEARREAIRSLEPDARYALGVVAANDGTLPDDLRRRLGIDDDPLLRLVGLGFLAGDADGYKLLRSGDAGDILASSDDVRAQHVQLAYALAQIDADSDEERAPREAARIRHLALAGETERAVDLVRESMRLVPLDAHAFVRAIEAIEPRSPQVGLLAARIFLAAGRTDRALRELGRVLRAKPALELRIEAKVQAAACYSRQGEAARAVRQYRAVLALDKGVQRRVEVGALLSRAHYMLGDYVRAEAVAKEALALGPHTPEREADLCEALGIASTYLGAFGVARDHLLRAAAIHERSGDPRARIHSASLRALNEYRAGDARAAAAGYRNALALSQEHGRADHVATSALNLGTASQLLGEWGEALSSYELGLRMATAVAQRNADANLRFNLAKLYVDVGLFERAAPAIARTKELAAKQGRAFFLAAVDALNGELALAHGDHEQALTFFGEAKVGFERAGASVEVLATELHRAEALLGAERREDARVLLAQIEPAIRAGSARDLTARLEIAAARASDDAQRAISLLESAARTAADLGQRALEAEALSELAHACERAGVPFLADEHRNRARSMWERIAATLPSQHRDAFFRHPKRAWLGAVQRPIASPTREISRERDLRRLLDINRKLSSTLRGSEVLDLAMDAAIELAGAERGFLILAAENENEELKVATARNLDREKIGRSHLKFSRSIAEQVIEEGEPVVTVDARSDERFGANTSVHAMRLKSVVCMPIRAQEKTLGALYLDNRFREGRFSEVDTDLLMAFADQVAIALVNARLHDELEARTKELEAAQQRALAQVDTQAAEIVQLNEKVREQKRVLERRYDYTQIIGKSSAMQSVFEVLDRVIETDVTVLVQGESGTGKELIARAIHFNGRRRDAPFCAINCGAVPASLLESELFGHVRGSFTGADRDRPGLFVEANGGSVFLDELGEMPLEMQVKLLRVLQEREVRPVGASKPQSIDVRVICATNRVLREEVEAGRFRRDLYYRIGVVEVHLPPLRDRREDIPELAQRFLERAGNQLHREPPRLSRSAMNALLGYGWPGNIRELENVLLKSALLFAGEEISAGDLNLGATGLAREPAGDRTSFEREEAAQIAAALRAHRWKVSEVARSLGIPRATLYRKLDRYGLKRKD